MVDDTDADFNQTIAARVRTLRAERKLSLESLATQSGVSRSMISLIERGESSATAVVLGRLASALGVTLGSLFEDAVPKKAAHENPLSRKAEQPEWQDPESGYRRRRISPAGQSLQIVEISFPAGARVAFESGASAQQQVWVLEGVMEVTAGEEKHRLREGDCLAARPDQPMMFHNPTRKTARYAVVIAPLSSGKR